MKRMSWLPLIILFFSINVFAQGGLSYIKPKTENIRVSPGGQKIGEVLSGTEVEILERRSNWVKVRLYCWIWDKSLTPDSTRVYGFQVSGSHILVETEEEADFILQKLRQGANFEDLARQYSIDQASGLKGGDLGKFSRGDLRPEFEDVIFYMKIGEISKVVKTDLGYHIIKRTGLPIGGM
jgi:hypothetical protein